MVVTLVIVVITMLIAMFITMVIIMVITMDIVVLPTLKIPFSAPPRPCTSKDPEFLCEARDYLVNGKGLVRGPGE